MKYYEVKLGTKTESFVEGGKASNYITYLGYIRKNIRENRLKLNQNYHFNEETETLLLKRVICGEIRSEDLRFSHFEDAVEVSMALGGKVKVSSKKSYADESEPRKGYGCNREFCVSHIGAFVDEHEATNIEEISGIHSSLRPLILALVPEKEAEEGFYDIEEKYKEFIV